MHPLLQHPTRGDGSTSASRGGGLLTAVSSKYAAEHEVLSFTDIVAGKAAALEIRTDKGGLTLINVQSPQAGCSTWAGRAAFWAKIQMYATAHSLGGRHLMVIAGDTNVYMDANSSQATEHFRAGWEACGFQRATAGRMQDMSPVLYPSPHRVDTFLVNQPPLLLSLQEIVWVRGTAHPQVIRSDQVPVRPALPVLLKTSGHAAVPGPYSHTESRLLSYDDEAALVQCCMWEAVTAAQKKASLPPSLGPVEQHAYGSMLAAAVDKVFAHLHAAHHALACTVGRRQPSLAGSDPAGGDPPESGKRLQVSILWYGALAACAPAAYQANAARHGIHSEAALRLTEALRSCIARVLPGNAGQAAEGPGEASSRPGGGHPPAARTPGCQLQARHQRLLAPPRPGHRPAVVSREKGHPGRGPGPVGLLERAGPQHPTLLMEAHDVMSAVRAFWRELYDKRPVDLPGSRAVLDCHVPRFPEGAWAQVERYSMQDLSRLMARPRAPNTWRPASSTPSRPPPPSSGSSSTPTGPSSVAPRRRCTGEVRIFGSPPRSRALSNRTTTSP